MNLPEIISGGQTGAERAALEWAIRNGVRHGSGWGVAQNVMRSGATVVFTLSANPGRRANLTLEVAHRQKMPWLHIHRRTRIPGLMLVSLISTNRVRRLNVSGSTAFEEPGIGSFVRQVLDQAAKLLLPDTEPLNYETRRNESTNRQSRSKPKRLR